MAFDLTRKLDPDLLIDPHTTPAWKKLGQLAAQPFDLTADGALSAARIEAMHSTACGMTLMYGTQRLDDAVLEALQELADQTRAVEQYQAMLRGHHMNQIVGVKCENRQVLHTATRNVFDALTCDCDADQSAAVHEAKAELEKLEEFLQDLDEKRVVNAKGEEFTELVQIGIGGSDLGPRAVYLAMRKFRKAGRRVHFVSNVDPDDAAAVLADLDLSRTLVNVVSKSGTTLETLTNELLVRAEFAKQGLDPARHFIAVTGKGSPMDKPGKYLQAFYMYDYIGGRYSACSMVGGVALAFGLGYENYVKFLHGAREMDLNSLETDIRKNLPLLNALIGIWNRNFLQHQTVAVLPYSQLLSRFAAHLQQLDMESNGKRVNRRGQAVTDYKTGPIVWGEPGTNGQHAFYQLIHQSETVIPCEFVAFRKSQIGRDMEVEKTTSQQKLLANVLAQSQALAVGRCDPNPNKVFPGNRPNSVLVIDRLTPQSIGRLLAYYENRVAFQGFIWNINSFDQEGVQLGKVLAGDYARVMLKDKEVMEDKEDKVKQAVLKVAGLQRNS